MTSVSSVGTNRLLLGTKVWESMVLDIERFIQSEGETVTPAVQHDFLVRLGDREEIAERTIACRLEKPSDFVFKPGQFIEITLLNPPETDAEGNSRAFSIASTPRDDFLLGGDTVARVGVQASSVACPTGDPGKNRWSLW